MATIGEVMIKLGGDASGFTRTLSTVTGNLTSAIGKIVKIGGIITGAFTGLAGIGLGVFTKQVADLGDDLLATSQKTGFTVEMLSALRLAAKLNNAEFGDLTTGLRIMNRNLANADEEGQAARETLMELGFSAADITSGMSQGAPFLESFAQKLAGIEAPAKRTQMAMAVLGRQGEALIPLLLDIAERGLGGVQSEADKLGATFTTKLAVASDRFNDNMTKLGAALNGLKVTVFGPLVTALATLTEQFLKSDMFAGFRAQIDSLASSGVLEAWAKKAVFFVVDAFAMMVRFTATSFEGLVTGAIAAFNGINTAVAGFSESMVNGIGKVSDLLLNFLRMMEGSRIWRSILGVDNIRESIGLIGEFRNSAQVAFTQIGQAAEAAKITKVPEGLQKVTDVLANVATQSEQFAEKAKKSFDSVREEVQSVTVAGGGMGESMQKMTTETGEVVTVAGNIGAKFDQATGAISIMNTNLMGTLTLMNQINATAVAPVQ